MRSLLYKVSLLLLLCLVIIGGVLGDSGDEDAVPDNNGSPKMQKCMAKKGATKKPELMKGDKQAMRKAFDYLGKKLECALGEKDHSECCEKDGVK